MEQLELHAGKVPLPSVSKSAAAENSWLFTYFEVSKASVQQQARGYTEYRQTLKLMGMSVDITLSQSISSSS